MNNMAKQIYARRGPNGLAWIYRGAALALLGVGLAGLPAHGGDVPEFLRVVIADRKPATECAVAEQNILVLDTSMMDIYDGSLAQGTSGTCAAGADHPRGFSARPAAG